MEYKKENPQRKRTMKEALYVNLKLLMEQGKIGLFDNIDTKMSLSSIQFEYEDGGKLKIWGSYSHIAEALIRVAWCMKEKSLNPWVR
jgi:hypothetical protein